MITIQNQTSIPITKNQEEIIERIVYNTLEKENKNKKAEVSITIVTNEEIKDLNNTYRNINKITDVLSFPMINYEIGEHIPTQGNYMLGDIVFSLDMAQLQCIQYGHSIEREIGFFIAHSMLHLLGYDHKTKQDEEIMLQKQEEILQSIGLYR